MILSYFEPDQQIIWLLLIENHVNVAAVADIINKKLGIHTTAFSSRK